MERRCRLLLLGSLCLGGALAVSPVLQAAQEDAAEQGAQAQSGSAKSEAKPAPAQPAADPKKKEEAEKKEGEPKAEPKKDEPQALDPSFNTIEDILALDPALEFLWASTDPAPTSTVTWRPVPAPPPAAD